MVLDKTLILVKNKLWMQRPKQKHKPRGRPPVKARPLSLNISFYYTYYYEKTQTNDRETKEVLWEAENSYR